MEAENLILGNDYIYINHNNEEIEVKYVGIDDDGLTFYKFRNNENKIVYNLFEHEVSKSILF